MNESKQLQLHNPQDVLTFANTLKSFVEKNNLSMEIQSKQYVLVDGWKFAGMNFGLTAIPHEPVKESQPGEIAKVFYMEKNYQGKKYLTPYDISAIPSEIDRLTKDTKTKQVREIQVHRYKCAVDIVNIQTGQKVGSGYAICSNEELKKVKFDEYSVSSMAQTRAIGKGFRNLIGFVMSAAGYAETPAEEMDEKLVTDEKIVGEMTDEDQANIDGFKEAEKLLEWAMEQEHLHNNEKFRLAVQAKRLAIEKGKPATSNRKKPQSNGKGK
jgi:hypothetical protein